MPSPVIHCEAIWRTAGGLGSYWMKPSYATIEPVRAYRSWPVAMATFSIEWPWFSIRAVTGVGA